MDSSLLFLMASAAAAERHSRTVEFLMILGEDAGKIIMGCIGLIALFLTRHIWGPPVYAMTCAKFHPPNPLDMKICGCSVGWCIMNLCCSCVFPPYHPPFRLRVIVHHAKSLRYTEGMVGVLTGKKVDAFVQIHVSHTPKKTTSVVQVPLKNDTFPVVWNEHIDFTIRPSMSKLHVTVWDQDFQSNDKVGEAVVLVEDFFKTKKTDYFCGMCTMGQERYPYADPFHKVNLSYRGKHAGSVWMTFIVAEIHKEFPEFMPAPGDEERPFDTTADTSEVDEGVDLGVSYEEYERQHEKKQLL